MMGAAPNGNGLGGAFPGQQPNNGMMPNAFQQQQQQGQQRQQQQQFNA
jgi:hypothetical protein